MDIWCRITIAGALKNGFCKEPVTFSFHGLSRHPFLFKLLNTYESFFVWTARCNVFCDMKKQNLVAELMASSRWRRQGKPFPLPRQSAKSLSRCLPWNFLFFLPLPQVFLHKCDYCLIVVQKSSSPTFTLWNSVDQHIACFIAKLITCCAYKTDKNLQKRVQRKTKLLCFASCCTFVTNT